MPERHRLSGKLRIRTAIATAAASGLALTALAVQADAGQTEAPKPEAAAGETLFDDFDYKDHADPKLAANGWSAREGKGGPGVSGASWAGENVMFESDGDNRVLNLRTTSAGTPESTVQSELSTKDMKFKNGTYAARVRFADAPGSGPDGDRLVQSFFTINQLKGPMDDGYGEYDFEYLPNGGWGEEDHTLFTTSWETYNPDTGENVNTHSASRQSFAGWHDLVLTIDGENITYYVDGKEVGKHGKKYLPEQPMSISFNQWLIDLKGQPATQGRGYDEKVDYVLHVKDQALTPGEVQAKVDGYRKSGTKFTDTVPKS